MYLFKKAAALSKKNNYIQGIGLSMVDIGSVYMFTGKYDSSIEIQKQAIFYCIAAHKEDVLPGIYMNLGSAVSYKGNYQDAALYYMLAIKEAAKHRGMEELLARIYANYAAMLFEINEPKKAFFYLDEGEKTLRKGHNSDALGTLLSNKVQALIINNRFKEAYPVLQEALTIACYTNDIDLQIRCLQNLGLLLLQENKPQQAIDSLQRALTLSSHTNPNTEAEVWKALSDAYSRLNNMPKAEYYLLRSLQLADAYQIPFSAMTVDAHYKLSSIYAATGRYQKAWEQLNSYIGIRDSIMGEDKVKDINQVESKYYSALKDKEIAQKQLLISQQQVRIEQNKKWAWVSSSGAALLLIISLLLYRNNRHRHSLEQERLRAMEQEQENRLLRAVMMGEEKERIRIGRELHDGIGGIMSAIKINFSAIRMQNKNMEHTEAFKNVFSLVDEATDEIRKTAHNLMPEMLLKGGLTEAVKNFCDRILQTDELTVQFVTYGTPVPLEASIELSVYRIVLELVNNVIKHAKASLVLVQVGWQDKSLNITIEDNGIGIDHEKLKKNAGTGLKNIQARVHALNGNIDLESIANAGTTVEIEFIISNLISGKP